MESSAITSASFQPFSEDLFLGKVYESGIASAKILVDFSGAQNGEHLSLRKACKIGEFTLFQCEDSGILGKIIDIQAAANGSQHTNGVDGDASSKVIATAEFLISIDFQTGEIFDGVVHQPTVNEPVYQAHSQLVKIVLEHQLDTASSKNNVLVDFAKLWNSSGTPIALTPEKIFGRHCAVLGMTGAGKSWSVSRLLEQCNQFQSKIILVDATGEYFTFDDQITHVHLGKDPNPLKISKDVVLPYYHLTELDLFAIFKPRGEYQAPKLREAMKSLKLARLEPALAPDGTIVKAHREKKEYNRAYQKHIDEVESPYATFRLEHLARQIRAECVDPQRSAEEPGIWGGPNAIAYSYCVPLVGRIEDMIKSVNLAPIFSPNGKASLLNELHGFLQDPNQKIFRISLQYLSFAHSVREIVANALGRYLLALARKDIFRQAPVVIVVDEAHQFLNKYFEEEETQYTLDSFALIAKEGRKYGVNIVLATQRPRDIPESVLSQMGTMIVHRLTNHLDRHVVERASGDVDSTSIQSLPSLTPGQAIIMGVDFPMPLQVKVLPPEAKPFSEGPNFQKYWKQGKKKKKSSE